MKAFNYISILLLMVLLSCQFSETLCVYVSPDGNNTNNGSEKSPVKTIEKALSIIKDTRTNTELPVQIIVNKGIYNLENTLQLSSELNNLSIIGQDNKSVRIRGSKKLSTQWTQFNENIWVTDIEEDIDFNQLFINNEKQFLCRYPNYDKKVNYWQGYAADAIAPEKVKKWNNPIGGFLHVMHQGRWGDFHYEFTGVNKKGELELTGGHQNNRPSPMHPELRMIENIFEELDSANEWFYDKENKKLYLWPSKEMHLETALVEVSHLNHLIEIKGDTLKPVKNIKISGLCFEHSRRTFMEEYEPLLRSDWTIYRGGSILLEGTQDCSISECEFYNLGGNAIFINSYNRGLEITNNHIHECGASAISFVGDFSSVRSPSYQYYEFVPFKDIDTIRGPKNDLYPASCLVENNLIHDIGRIEKQVAGVQISMAMSIHVKNNSIYNVPRAGINISEGTWGGHIIEFNDVFNTVLESGDHGAFNSWGRDRFWHPRWTTIDSIVKANPQSPYWDAMHTTIIRNNRFRCDHGWDIDLDDGSSNYHIYNNVCLNGGIKLREGFGRTVENNIMINNGFHPHVWFSESHDIFRRNIVMTKHFPIGLHAWGKEVDYNLFPDSISLSIAQKNNTDQNSLFGPPMFIEPKSGNYTVNEESKALKLGFKNFNMDLFGVQNLKLKELALQAPLPELNIVSEYGNSSVMKWLGSEVKNIENKEEQSASGLHTMDGVKIIRLGKKSKLKDQGFNINDVIIKVEGQKIKNTNDLISKYQENLWHGQVRFTIIRDQKEMEISLRHQ